MPEQVDIFQTLLRDLPADKKFYCNGYTVAVSPADVMIVLLFNNQPVATLNTPLTVAKTLMKVVENLIKDYETKTGQKVLTLEEIAGAS